MHWQNLNKQPTVKLISVKRHITLCTDSINRLAFLSTVEYCD